MSNLVLPGSPQSSPALAGFQQTLTLSESFQAAWQSATAQGDELNSKE